MSYLDIGLPLVFAEPNLGEQLKSQGQAKALKRAGSGWLATALIALRNYCEDQYAGDVLDITIDAFRSSGYMHEPVNPNAWGALPRAAVKAGYIKPTTRTEKALRPKAQARVVRVWDINPESL